MPISQKTRPKCLAAAAAIAGSLILSSASAEPTREEGAPEARTHSPYRPTGLPSHASNYFRAAWGVDNLRVKRTASGTLVRFSYRVTDPERAKVLGDKDATAQLIDPQRGVMLQVPVMEKIGQLRQTGTQVAGKEYWMVFSNKGDVVKAGDRVDVVIGTFHAAGLPVE